MRRHARLTSVSKSRIRRRTRHQRGSRHIDKCIKIVKRWGIASGVNSDVATKGAERAVQDPAERVHFTHEAAASYSAVELVGPYRLAAQAVHARLAPLREGIGHLVDYGCGAGKSTRAVADCVRDGGRVTGVDISAEMLAEAVRLTPSPGTRGITFDFRRISGAADLATVPLESGCADVVVTTTVMQELQTAVQLGAAFREIGRITRPGGLLVGVFVNDLITCEDFTAYTYAPFPDNRKRGDNIRRSASTVSSIVWEHDRHWSRDVFATSIAASGFEITEEDRPLGDTAVAPFPDDPARGWLDELHFSPFLVICGQKRAYKSLKS